MDLGAETADAPAVGPAEARVLLGQVEAIHFALPVVAYRKSRAFPSFGRIGRVAPYQAYARARATVRGKRQNASDASETGVGQAPYRGSSV